MTLQGCCCCGLRGGAKAVGVLFLVITLLHLLGVIMAWVLLVVTSPNTLGYGVDTSEGQFGVQLRETQSVFGGRGGDLTVNLGKFGKFGSSISSDGRVSGFTHEGPISSSGSMHYSGPVPDYTDLHITYICSTVFGLLALIFNSMLIHGTDHDSSCAVLAWLVFYGALFVVMSLGSVGGLIFMAILLLTETSYDSETCMGACIGSGVGLLVCALLWFWWALVLTFYRELRDDTRGYGNYRDVSLQEPPTQCPANEQRKAEACV